MSFHWGSKKFETLTALKNFLGSLAGKKLRIEDDIKTRTRIITDDEGFVVDTQKLFKNVRANGEVWYSSWYKAPYNYPEKKIKRKTLREALQKAFDKDGKV